MISFAVDPRYIQDLRDDFVMNETLTLYEFIGSDPIKAFYLGLKIEEWFEDIDRKQRYLYSKQARHNKDDLEKYQSQIEFWSKKFPEQDGDIEMAILAEFIINNMIWDEKTEELDTVKMAFFFGQTINNQSKSNETDESSQEEIYIEFEDE